MCCPFLFAFFDPSSLTQRPLARLSSPGSSSCSRHLNSVLHLLKRNRPLFSLSLISSSARCTCNIETQEYTCGLMYICIRGQTKDRLLLRYSVQHTYVEHAHTSTQEIAKLIMPPPPTRLAAFRVHSSQTYARLCLPFRSARRPTGRRCALIQHIYVLIIHICINTRHSTPLPPSGPLVRFKHTVNI